MMQDPILGCHGGCSSCEAIALALTLQLRARPRVLLDLDKVFNAVKPFADGHLDVEYVQIMVTIQIVKLPEFSTLL
jgi:hypothetical protein